LFRPCEGFAEIGLLSLRFSVFQESSYGDFQLTMSMYVYVYVCICLCMYMCMYVYVYIMLIALRYEYKMECEYKVGKGMQLIAAGRWPGIPE